MTEHYHDWNAPMKSPVPVFLKLLDIAERVSHRCELCRDFDADGGATFNVAVAGVIPRFVHDRTKEAPADLEARAEAQAGMWPAQTWM
ncbi:hypothetical protein R69608_03211 [Paraburkholderia nemoris]|uniref:hypothetical protein n=1 Tax=Paraburkholderia nemoris TaxID=2793076 RepID=UPI001914178C|nr:hypothetical protein [Paraburkholderia nemoris]MBK5148536.1 hypothetical protein [Burkholderia sp. R-69608]CAE6905987.1 hypothetical protein R69608_03211 [Paraburkholderia nemoris]